jgi:hypothetical protein
MTIPPRLSVLPSYSPSLHPGAPEGRMIMSAFKTVSSNDCFVFLALCRASSLLPVSPASTLHSSLPVSFCLPAFPLLPSILGAPIAKLHVVLSIHRKDILTTSPLEPSLNFTQKWILQTNFSILQHLETKRSSERARQGQRTACLERSLLHGDLELCVLLAKLHQPPHLHPDGGLFGRSQARDIDAKTRQKSLLRRCGAAGGARPDGRPGAPDSGPAGLGAAPATLSSPSPAPSTRGQARRVPDGCSTWRSRGT